MVVGQYHLVAMTLNSLGVEPESDDFPVLPAFADHAGRAAAPTPWRLRRSTGCRWLSSQAARSSSWARARSRRRTPTPRWATAGPSRSAPDGGSVGRLCRPRHGRRDGDRHARRGRGSHRHVLTARGRRRCVPRPGRGGGRCDGRARWAGCGCWGSAPGMGMQAHDPLASGTTSSRSTFVRTSCSPVLRSRSCPRVVRSCSSRPSPGWRRAAASPPTTRRRLPSTGLCRQVAIACGSRPPIRLLRPGPRQPGPLLMHLGDPAGALRRMAARGARAAGWSARSWRSRATPRENY